MRKRKMAVVLSVALVVGMLITGGGSAQAALSANAAPAGTAPVTREQQDETENVTAITLKGNTIAVEGEGATVDGTTVTVTAAGSYRVSGTLDDGQLIVDTTGEESVRLILSGADIHSSTSAPLTVAAAKDVVIVLDTGTENVLSDGAAYIFANSDEDEPNAALFSAADLAIEGSGALTVTGSYNDGIASKDDLTLTGGTFTVSAVDDGIRGKDSIVVQDATITVTAQGDGLKADNAEDAAKGHVTIESGTLNITAGGDGIQAETTVAVAGGQLTIVSGGGSASVIAEDASAKGIKAAGSVTLDSGSVTIDSADDALHSNGTITINDGTFALSSGDDAVHADTSLDINGGEIWIARSYEGLESAVITLNAGSVHIVASDDGVNVAGGNDGSGVMAGPGRGGRSMGGFPGQGATPGQGTAPSQGGTPPQGGFGGQEMFAASGDYSLNIHGGYLTINSGGDGIDSNGSIEMTSGTVLIDGPTESMNSALDYQGSFGISGGLFMATGSAGMAQAPDQTSTQPSVLLNLNAAQPAGTLVHVQSSNGNEIVTFAPTKLYQSIALSSPQLALGSTIQVFLGGSASGAASDGLYQGGSYTPGAEYTSLTLSSVVTSAGEVFRGR